MVIFPHDAENYKRLLFPREELFFMAASYNWLLARRWREVTVGLGQCETCLQSKYFLSCSGMKSVESFSRRETVAGVSEVWQSQVHQICLVLEGLFSLTRHHPPTPIHFNWSHHQPDLS